MSRTIPRMVISAALLLACLAPVHGADEAAAAAPGSNFVSLEVGGCGDRCAEFEISIYDNGRLLFTPKNSKNSTRAPLSKTGMQNIYRRVSKYLQDSGAFNMPVECADRRADAPFAVVNSSTAGQVRKATWSSGCSNQLEKARSLVKVFVNQTGMWRNINSDSRYWEKYWETWEEKK